jgi:hypothetical protein
MNHAIEGGGLPLARLLHPITCAEPQGGDCVAIPRGALGVTALLSDRLVDAGWQSTLRLEGTFLELVAIKRHQSLRAAVDELLALTATGTVYLDAPDQCSTIAYADLEHPTIHHPVDDPPSASRVTVPAA